MGAVSPWAAYVKPLTDQMSAFGQDQQTRLNAYAAQNVAAQATVAKAQASPLLGGPLGYFLDSAHDTKAAAAAAAAALPTIAKAAAAKPVAKTAAAAATPAAATASTNGGGDNAGYTHFADALGKMAKANGGVSLADITALAGAIGQVSPHYSYRDTPTGDALHGIIDASAEAVRQAQVAAQADKGPATQAQYEDAQKAHVALLTRIAIPPNQTEQITALANGPGMVKP